MLRTYTFILGLLSTILILSACKKEYESIESIDEAKIKAYVDKNPGFTKDPSGFYFKVVTPGTGGILANTDSVFYNFDITGLDGTFYQGSKSYNNIGNYLGYVTPTPFRISLLGLNRGAEVKLVIPSYLAFGKNGSENIPSNEIIISNIKTLAQSTQWEIDDRRIVDFLATKNITNGIKHPSRVYYQVITPGTGTAVIDQYSTLVVKFTGRLIDGTVFDTSESFSTTLRDVIPGWGKVLLLFKSGTKVRLLIPSDLAYGKTGSTDQFGRPDGRIPANCVLDFDIEIVSVTN